MKDVKTVPDVPLSHPFVERLIGTIRRECLDRTFFWTAADLEMKLLDFQRYYNGHRTHAGLEGRVPEPSTDPGCAHTRLSVRIDGSRTVGGCIRRQWPRDACDGRAGRLRTLQRVERLNATVCSVPELNLAGRRSRADSPHASSFRGIAVQLGIRH